MAKFEEVNPPSPSPLLYVKVKFMHLKLQTPSLKLPSRNDLYWVPNVNVSRVVSPPELSSQTPRMYYFNTSECDKIEKQ